MPTASRIKHIGTGTLTPGPPAASTQDLRIHPAPVPSGRTHDWLCQAGPGTPHSSCTTPETGVPDTESGGETQHGDTAARPPLSGHSGGGPAKGLSSSSVCTELAGSQVQVLVRTHRRVTSAAGSERGTKPGSRLGALTQALGHADPRDSIHTAASCYHPSGPLGSPPGSRGALTGRRWAFGLYQTRAVPSPHTQTSHLSTLTRPHKRRQSLLSRPPRGDSAPTFPTKS